VLQREALMVDVDLIGFEPMFDVISRYQLQFSNLSGLAATGRIYGGDEESPTLTSAHH